MFAFINRLIQIAIALGLIVLIVACGGGLLNQNPPAPSGDCSGTYQGVAYSIKNGQSAEVTVNDVPYIVTCKQGQINAVPKENPPAQPTAASVVPTQAPLPTTVYTPVPPAPPVATCLNVSDFTSMWSASSPSQGPGLLINALNSAFDASHGTIGTQWSNGPKEVQPMSLVWTDLLGQPAPAPAGKWVPLRVQGGWGVYAIYDRVTVPTPGRSALMCTSLDPAKDLSGWGK